VRRRKRQGLCKLPSDAIIKARDDTGAQVNRITLTFVGTVVFCVLSLLAPDAALLVGSEKLNVPLIAGPVSFLGFMLLGPAVLIVLRIYLQIYVEHQRRLDRIAQWIPAGRGPTLTPDKNPLMRGFRGFAVYLLLPVTMLAFWLKAAALPEYGRDFFIVMAAVVAMHLTLPFPRLSWPLRAVLSLGAAILAIVVIMSFGIPLKRPFFLFRANLTDQWLPGVNFERARLDFANLSRANLSGANLTGASLSAANLSDAGLGGAKLKDAFLGGANLIRAYLADAHLTGAHLNGADLTGAYLTGADLTAADLIDAHLSGAHLNGANFNGANLSHANLDGADGLAQQQLDTACGNEQTRLPAGLSVKFCSQH
jgi:hypothetical protein